MGELLYNDISPLLSAIDAAKFNNAVEWRNGLDPDGYSKHFEPENSGLKQKTRLR
jgi:hypothetical protein